MSGVDLRESLVDTLCYLLESKQNIELQLKEAEKVVKFSFEQKDNEKLRPISVEEDAVWLNYLISLLNQTKADIALVEKALSQLGVSSLELLLSNAEKNTNKKGQGIEALDLSASKER